MRCEGDVVGAAWLNARAADGDVELAAAAASFWRVHDAGGGAVALECFSEVPGRHWLAGDAGGRVRLAQSEDMLLVDGLWWRAHDMGDGVVALQHARRAPGILWLCGGVGAGCAALTTAIGLGASSEGAPSRGTRWRVIPALSNFTFDPELSAQARARLLERHRFALSQIVACGGLTAAEKAALLATYRRPIRHSVTFEDGVYGRARVGGSQIWVNTESLFPQGDDEIAQTLIHEMMHCAGFAHPERQVEDVALDGGPYYESPPLRAELCIAGMQSDQQDSAVDVAPDAGRPRPRPRRCCCADSRRKPGAEPGSVRYF